MYGICRDWDRRLDRSFDHRGTTLYRIITLLAVLGVSSATPTFRDEPPPYWVTSSTYQPDLEQPAPRMPAYLTINGTSVQPLMECYGGRAVPTSITCQDTLIAFTEDGSSITTKTSSVWGTNSSVNFAAGDYYIDGSNSYGDIGTGDIVFEAVLRVDTLGLRAVIEKRTAVASNIPGWIFWVNSNVLFFRLGVTGAEVDLTSATISVDTWYHFIAFLDRSGSGQIYLNGVASGSPLSLASVTASGSTTGSLRVGAAPGGTFNFDGDLVYAALWESSGWLDTHLQATIAAERACYAIKSNC